jgi:CRP/FNR family transcriptional regulator, cyclic AMP receptor protein
VQLSDNNGETGKGGECLQLMLSQEEIGQLIGTSRETVTRALSNLKKRRILEIRGCTLVIRDRSELMAIAGLQTNA